MSSVSVVIPVYGRSDLVEKCLQAVRTSFSGEVIVIDDYSPDDQKHRIRELCVEYGTTLHRNRDNMGFPATVNRGMNKVKTPYALILNSDVTLEPDVISILEGELDNSRRTAIAAPMLLFAEGSQYGPTDKIQHVGMAFNVFGQPIHLFVGWSVTNSRAVQRRDTLSCVTGACMMVRYSIWKEIGGFSLNYGRGTYEDVEFCVLAKVKGHDIVVNPLAVGHHLVGQSSAVGNEPFSLQMNEQIFRLRVGQLIRNDDILFW